MVVPVMRPCGLRRSVRRSTNPDAGHNCKKIHHNRAVPESTPESPPLKTWTAENEIKLFVSSVLACALVTKWLYLQ